MALFHIVQFFFFGSRLNLYTTLNMAYLLDHIIIRLGLSLGVDVVTYVGQLVKDCRNRPALNTNFPLSTDFA